MSAAVYAWTMTCIHSGPFIDPKTMLGSKHSVYLSYDPFMDGYVFRGGVANHDWGGCGVVAPHVCSRTGT
jgi:hypothetical protein